MITKHIEKLLSVLRSRAWSVWLLAALGLAFVPPLRAEPTKDDAALSADLQRHVGDIESDLARLHQILIAVNLAVDPSARAAAIGEAKDSLARLIRECREAEGLYAKLQQSLPKKVDAASRPAVNSDLAEIRAGLGEADADLVRISALVASAPK